MRKTTKQEIAITESIVNGLFEKKGKDVTLLDLRDLENRVCDYFIISHATSNTQVDSLAWSVEDIVRKETGRKPAHIEGTENCIWVLMDYGDVIVHIFQEEYRNFYNLESLWADGKISRLEDIHEKKGV
jgi:ribosome-associated protein